MSDQLVPGAAVRAAASGGRPVSGGRSRAPQIIQVGCVACGTAMLYWPGHCPSLDLLVCRTCGASAYGEGAQWSVVRRTIQTIKGV